MTHGDWPPLDIPEFRERNYSLTSDFPDEFDPDGVPVYVKKVDPVEAQQARRISIDQVQDEFLKAQGRQRLQEKADDGARLDSYEAQQERRFTAQLDPGRNEFVVTDDDGVRLDSYEARRLRTISDIVADLNKAMEQAGKGRTGAKTLGFNQLIRDKISEAIAALDEAVALIGDLEE